MAVQEKRYTVEEFWEYVSRLENVDQRFELIDGEIVEVPPPSKRNSMIAADLLTFINNHVHQFDLGRVLGADGGFTLLYGNVRMPDVSFVAKHRLDEMEHTEGVFAPDLAVEVISPSETPRSITAKTALYLNSGSRMVWNVYPDDSVIEVWQKGDGAKLEMQAFGVNDMLDGSDVLPGFSLKVSAIFAE